MKNICPIALGTLIGAILLCQACIPTQTPETAIAENEALFCRLDSLIAHRDTFIVRKERKIEQLKRQLAHIDEAEQQHTCLQELYWAYRVYDADSAMKYITLYQELAQRHHQSDWEVEALLDQAEKTMGKNETNARAFS